MKGIILLAIWAAIAATFINAPLQSLRLIGHIILQAIIWGTAWPLVVITLRNLEPVLNTYYLWWQL